MTSIKAKKRIENIVNWSVHYGNIALTHDDIEALNYAIGVICATQGFSALLDNLAEETDIQC